MTSQHPKPRSGASICIATGAAIAFFCGGVAAAPWQSGVGDDKQLEVLWAFLEKADADASRALLKLSALPKKDVVAFLAKKMRPLKIGKDQVKSLLAELASKDEATWKRAFSQLEYFDPRLAIDLVTLMETVTESPARERLVEVLSGRLAESLAGKNVDLREIGDGEGYNFVADNASWWAEHRIARINSSGWGTIRPKWTQCVRAIVLLEHIGTPDAVAVLNSMAKGHPDAQPTKAAKEAIKRLADNSRRREGPSQMVSPLGTRKSR